MNAACPAGFIPPTGDKYCIPASFSEASTHYRTYYLKTSFEVVSQEIGKFSEFLHFIYIL